MKHALLALWLIGAIVNMTNGASAQSLEAASIESEHVEVHSVVVDTPQVISLPPASPEAWHTFWDTLPSSVQLDEQRPATEQAVQSSPDPNETELLSSSVQRCSSAPAPKCQDLLGIISLSGKLV